MCEVVVALQLSQALQEKFDKSAQAAGVIGFTWKMQKYFFLPTKENSGHGDTNFSRNGKININCGSVPTEDGGDHNEVHPGGEQVLTQDLKIFSYTDMQRATRNFGNSIMRSGRNWVYKGWVHEKTYSPSELDVGLAITVKRLHGSEWDLQILAEFSHPNLVKLLGYCLECQTLYLVHEFMEKRSLKDYMRKGAAAELPFIKRVKIAVGVARGLVFLQHKQLIIIDWILDTNEIWLDKDFNAKLFYFDVAKLVNRLAQYPLIGPSFRRRQCDVYGLGLLLMEMLTGQPILTKPQMDSVEKEHLSGEVAEMSNKMIQDMVDPRIKLNAPQIERARELLLLILKCTRYHYTMEQALKELEQIYSRATKR